MEKKEAEASDSAAAKFACTNSRASAGKHAEGKKQILWSYTLCWYQLERLLRKGQSGSWLRNCAYYLLIQILILVSVIFVLGYVQRTKLVMYKIDSLIVQKFPWLVWFINATGTKDTLQ